jgi:polysaccharide biosynthesis transport protein
MDGQREVTLLDYVRVVWRRKWFVVAGVSVAALGALAASSAQDAIYSAEAQMLVEPRSGDAVFQQDQNLAVSNLDRRIQTEIQVLEGQQVRQRVQHNLGLDELPPDVDGTAVGSTDVVSVNVRSGDPRAAQILADSYIDAYIDTRRELAVADLNRASEQLRSTVSDLQGQIDATDEGSTQRQALIAQQATFKERLDQLQIDAALTTGGASIVQSAELPTDPVEPKPIAAAMLAAVVGLIIGLAAAFIIDFLDDSIRVADDLAVHSDLPVLAVVPGKAPPDHRPIALSEPHEFAVEVYRGLRTSVQFLGLDKPLRVLQVTSALPGEGKTTTATNLAVVLAQAGKQVAVVDADLRKPRIYAVFGLPTKPGLTEALIGSEALDMAISHLGTVHVVVAGTMAPNPSEMLASGRFATLIQTLASRYDYVIVDSAPVLPVADALALSRVVDGVLLVCQAGRTTRRTLAEAKARLSQVGAPLVGLVLNRATERSSKGYGYGYGYQYGEPPVSSATPALPLESIVEPAESGSSRVGS